MELGVTISALLGAVVFIAPMCFSPGPNNLLCAAHGSHHGWKRTIPLTLGMVVGWSGLGLGVGLAATFLEQNASLVTAFTWIGAIYIAYLAFKMSISKPMPANDDLMPDGGVGSSDDPLGFMNGLVLQLVNGKAWIHFMVLMTVFGSTFGSGFVGKVMLVILNAMFGYPAVLTWTAVGVTLSRIFSSTVQARFLNGILSLLLFAVAVWVVWPT